MCVCHVLYRIPSPYLYFKHPVNGPKYLYILYLGSVSPIIGYVYRFSVGPSSNGWFANGKMNIILDKSSLFVGHSTQAMFFVPSSPAGTKSHSVMQLGIWPIKGWSGSVLPLQLATEPCEATSMWEKNAKRNELHLHMHIYIYIYTYMYIYTYIYIHTPTPADAAATSSHQGRRLGTIRPGARGARSWPWQCRKERGAAAPAAEHPPHPVPSKSPAFYGVFCCSHFFPFFGVCGWRWVNMGQHRPQDGPT